MSSRLHQIRDWRERAQLAGFHVATLAAHCQVSERQLRRHIESQFALPPHVWMMRLRLEAAPALLRQGLLIKEVADKLGFKNADHFSRAFRKHYHLGPRNFHPASGLR